MGWFTNLEKNIAGKLASAFMEAKTLSEQASDDLVKAEANLVRAKQRAADLAAAAHQAAVAAVEKATQETEKLMEEAKAAKEKAEYHAGLVVSPQEPTMDLTPAVEPTLAQQYAASQTTAQQ